MRPQSVNARHALEGKIFAFLSYVSILCILPLVFKKDNHFVLAHSKQGLVLFVFETVVFVAGIIFPEWLVRILFFYCGVLSVWGMVEVLRGRELRLPFIAVFADKISL